MIVKTTFGKSAAGFTLSKILSEQNLKPKRILILYNEFNSILNSLKKIDVGLRIYLGELTYHDFKYKINKINYPTEIKTYFTNVITAKYRPWMKEQRNLLKLERYAR